jgi:hypothetical protein
MSVVTVAPVASASRTEKRRAGVIAFGDGLLGAITAFFHLASSIKRRKVITDMSPR